MNLTFRMLQHTSSEVTVGKSTNKFKRKVRSRIPAPFSRESGIPRFFHRFPESRFLKTTVSTKAE